jgi:hypothetical protein
MNLPIKRAGHRPIGRMISEKKIEVSRTCEKMCNRISSRIFRTVSGRAIRLAGAGTSIAG